MLPSWHLVYTYDSEKCHGQSMAGGGMQHMDQDKTASICINDGKSKMNILKNWDITETH